MKTRTLPCENTRKWGGGGRGLIWWGKATIMGLIRNQRGSVQREKLVFWYEGLFFCFFEKSFDGHLCLFVLTFCFLKGRRADFWHKLVWVKWEKEDLPQTVPHCAVLTSTSVSNGSGGGSYHKGRAVFLSLEPGYPAVSTFYDELSQRLPSACPQTP